MQLKWMLRVISVLLILAGVAACEGLAGEPEIVSTLPARAIPTSEPENFTVAANLEQGAQIYAENCVRCHGITGEGDGELALSGEVQNVPDFTDPLTIQDMTLQEWFGVITNGRMEALMPPWGGSLTAQQRWAVALYTYTMSYDSASIETGEALYAQQCAECHAPDGSGTEEGSSVFGLVSYTESELQSMLATHQTELEIAPANDDAALNDLVQYLRVLSATSQQLPETAVAAAPDEAVEPTQPQEPQEPATTEEAAAGSGDSQAATTPTPVEIPQSIGIIRGQILQGTEGGAPVEGLEAIVHIYDSQLREQIGEYTVGADGIFQYDEVIIRPDYAYRVSVEYDGISYSSPIRIGNPDETEMNIDVTIYETGASTSDLLITSRATQINLASNGLYIIEVVEMTNLSDRTYVQENLPGFSERASVSFPLPQGAQLQLQHTDPNRILLSEDGSAVADAAPVLPGGEHYVQYGYLLPIEDARSIEQPVDYPVAGRVAFFVENSHLDFSGDGMSLMQSQSFNNQTYDIYELNAPPSPGDVVNYAVTLRTDAFGGSGDGSVSRSLIAVLLVVAGVALVGSAGFIVWRSRGANDAPEEETPPEETSTMLIQQIAQLDKAFEAGEIDKREYQKQRDKLKARLMQLMAAEQPES